MVPNEKDPQRFEKWPTAAIYSFGDMQSAKWPQKVNGARGPECNPLKE